MADHEMRATLLEVYEILRGAARRAREAAERQAAAPAERAPTPIPDAAIDRGSDPPTPPGAG